MKRKFTFKICGLISIFACLLITISPIVRLKQGEVAYVSNKTQQEHINVGFFGGSHGLNGYIPSVAWDNSGFTSYNFSVAGQPIYLTYYYMKEAMKSYKMDVMVVDLYYLGLENEYFSRDSNVRTFLDNIKFSPNKVDMIKASQPEENWLSCYFNLIQYHERWDSLTSQDFVKDKNRNKSSTLGWVENKEQWGKVRAKPVSSTEKEEIPEKSYTYLMNIIQLAKEENIELVFIDLPHDFNNGVLDKWVKSEVAMFNTVKEVCAKEGVPFIEFNDLEKELNFDFAKDMTNAGHMYITGAYKTTLYLSDYIKTKYSDKLKANEDPDTWNTYYRWFIQDNATVIGTIH